MERLKRKIESNKKLIENDGLILPTEMDYEVAELVLSNINGYDNSKSLVLSESTYDMEMEKVFRMCQLFPYSQSEADITTKIRQILNRVSICRIMPDNQYSSTFKCQGQIPWDLNIPKNLNRLSHVYIGHELIHLLKDTNSSEWVNLLSYSEVLPILYEFIQTRYKRSYDRQAIVDYRINSLLVMKRRLEVDSANDYFKKNPQELIYYQLPEYGYFISFYYATLLYKLYLSNPKEVLKQIKRVLLHEQTTKELLEYFGLYDDWDLFGFGESYQKLLTR